MQPALICLQMVTVNLARHLDWNWMQAAFGMGHRSQRFALVADDGVVTHLMIEAPGEFRVSSAESVLACTLKRD